MKKLVWLLVLINVGLLIYFNKEAILPNAPKAALQEIQPEKVSILTQKDIDALPQKSVASPAPLPSPEVAVVINPPTVVETTPPSSVAAKMMCYEWGVFSATNLTAAQAAVSGLSLQAIVNEQSSTEARRFWVYKPPLKSAEAAQAKALELKALGIDELYIVQDSRWKNAISFGVFEDEQLATNLLNELKAKGVREVVKALRNQGKGHASLQFNQISELDVAEIKKLKTNFPEAEVKEIPCN